MLADAAPSADELARLIDRRAEGLPLEHVVGWAEFCGLRVAVEPGVFVPRPRTEVLVREAAALLSPGRVVVDLCCGSGAVGAALAAAEESIELHAADLDPVAVRCARRNVERVYEGDLFERAARRTAGPGRRCWPSTRPYVPSEDVALLPREARLHEPPAGAGRRCRRPRRAAAGDRGSARVAALRQAAWSPRRARRRRRPCWRPLSGRGSGRAVVVVSE